MRSRFVSSHLICSNFVLECMQLKAIYADNVHNVIGNGKCMPWHIPEDLQHFRELTLDGVCIMGRGTWESLPPKFRPLPNRLNVIITRDESYEAPGAVIRHDLHKTIDEYLQGDKQVWIIGGADILSQAWKRIEVIERTIVFDDTKVGVKVPNVFRQDWKKTAYTRIMRTYAKCGLEYVHQTWIRR